MENWTFSPFNKKKQVVVLNTIWKWPEVMSNFCMHVALVCVEYNMKLRFKGDIS